MLRPTWFHISNFSSQVMWSAIFKSLFLLVALFWHFLYQLSKKLEVEVEKKLQRQSSASACSNQHQLGQAAQEGTQFLITSIWRLHSLAVLVFNHAHKKGFLWFKWRFLYRYLRLFCHWTSTQKTLVLSNLCYSPNRSTQLSLGVLQFPVTASRACLSWSVIQTAVPFNQHTPRIAWKQMTYPLSFLF